MRRIACELQWLTLAIAAAVTGCSSEPPKCSDKATARLVKQIIVDQFKEERGTGFAEEDLAAQLELLTPSAEGYEEKIKRWTCSATLRVGSTGKMPLRYQSQLDDSNTHIVSIEKLDFYDLQGIAMAVVISAEKEVWKRSRRSPFIGKKPSELLETIRWHQVFAYSDHATLLRERLYSGPPMREEGGWLIGEGAIPKREGRDEAIFALDLASRDLFYVVRVDGDMYRLHGARDLAGLPAPLQEWVRVRRGH